jgi:hypothetical protein
MSIIEAIMLSAGDVKSLYWKLIVATRRLEARDREAAAGHVRAFMLEVEELMLSGRLSREDGEPLVRHANSLAEHLALDPRAVWSSELARSNARSPSREQDPEEKAHKPAEPPAQPDFLLAPRTPSEIRFSRFHVVRRATAWLWRSR